MAGVEGDGRPHVGRHRELEHLISAIGEPERRGAIVAGVPGVGKSHLVDLAAERLAGAGWVPLRAQGDPARITPFGSMAALLPQLAGDPDRWALVLRRGIDHLVDQAAPARPLLVTDDLQAFDAASATLVLQAVLDGRLRVLGTLRRGGHAPDAVTSLWKDDLVDRVELEPLGRDESDELVERLVGGPVDAETRSRLWGWAEGSPLLLTELVTYARDRGGWRHTAGLWHLHPRAALPLVGSPTVAGLLDERMADVPEGVADLVDALAVAGHLPLAVLQRLVGPRALAVAERARLTRTRDDPDLVTLDHPLYGEVRRTSLGADRRADLRDRLLDVFEQLDTIGPADVPLLARWYVESGRIGPRTAEMLTSAAELAWAGDDPRAAIRLARLAWDLRPDDRNARVLIGGLARLGEADELRRVVDEVTRSAGSEETRADAVLNHALFLFQFANQPDAAERLLEEAAGQMAEPRHRDTLLVETASYRLQRGDLDGAEDRVRPLAESDDLATAAAALGILSPVRLFKGQVGEASALAERGLGLATQHWAGSPGSHLAVGEHVIRQVGAWAEGGKLREAEVVAHGAISSLDRDVDPFSRAFVSFEAGRVARLRGQVETAARWFREATASFERIRRRGFVALAAAGLADARAKVGDVAGARDAAEHCRSQQDHPIAVAAAERDRSLAWVDVASGDLETAATAFADAARRSLDAGELLHAAHAFHDLVRIGYAGMAADGLAFLCDHTDGVLAPVFAAHARAAADDSPEAVEVVEAVATRFGELGCDLHAAEAWSQAAELATTVLHDERRAVAARRKAAQAAAGCEGARTPLLGGPAAQPAGVDLSRREQEIAQLTVAGLRRREIAEKLVVSPRTVDSHLQRIYRKLGVRDRQGLAAALEEAGLRDPYS
jgi:DNA-binding NarL/FixJ family response regulator